MNSRKLFSPTNFNTLPFRISQRDLLLFILSKVRSSFYQHLAFIAIFLKLYILQSHFKQDFHKSYNLNLCGEKHTPSHKNAAFRSLNFNILQIQV